MLHWISTTSLITMSQFYNQKKSLSISSVWNKEKSMLSFIIYQLIKAQNPTSKEKCWMDWFWDRKSKAYEGIRLCILAEMGFKLRVACVCELHGPLSFNGGFSILFWVCKPFTSFISLVLGHKIYRPQIQFIASKYLWLVFFFGNKELSLNFF